MDTARIRAVSLIISLQTGAVAAAVLQLKAKEFIAVIVIAPFVECEAIVSLWRTFVNESNTTTSSYIFIIFCAETPIFLFCIHNCHTFP